jgi:hypothetical protein
MVGNAACSLALPLCSLLTPSLSGCCTGYQTPLRLQGRSFVAAFLARSLFRRYGRSGIALCEPRGRGDGPAWRGNVKQAGAI